MEIGKNEWGEDMVIIKNVDDYDLFATAFKDIIKRAVPIAKTYLELKGEFPAFGIDEENISLDSDGDILISYETGGRGYYDDESMCLPSRYLFDPDWAEEAKAEVEKKRELKRQEDERKRTKAEAAKKTREHEQYLKLKAKFEGDA